MSDRDTAQIETELEATRARLGANLDELTRRLSPGQLLDEGLAYLRTDQAAVFARNLGTQVRDHPLPVTVAALGLGWLALSSSLDRMPSAPRPRPAQYDARRIAAQRELAENARRAGVAMTRMANESEEAFRGRVAEAQAGVMGLARRAQESAESFMERVQEVLDHAQEAAEDSIGQMRDTAGEWAQAAGATAQHARSAAGGLLEQGKQRAGSYASLLSDSSSGIGSALLQNPVLLSALGVAAGALFGALLPPTEIEKQYIGEVAQRAADTARGSATDVVQRGASVARAAIDAGYQAAQEQGLTPGNSASTGDSEQPAVRH